MKVDRYKGSFSLRGGDANANVAEDHQNFTFVKMNILFLLNETKRNENDTIRYDISIAHHELGSDKPFKA